MIFFYHYNKPASKKAGKPIWSLHYWKACHLVEEIICNVPTATKANKRQPYGVVRGECSTIIFNDKQAYIS